MLFNENMQINMNIPVDVKHLNPYFWCPWSWIFSLFSVFSVISEALFPWCFFFCQEEDEVPDDETVNQMIARSEDEFDQFMVSFHFFSLTLTSRCQSPNH